MARDDNPVPSSRTDIPLDCPSSPRCLCSKQESARPQSDEQHPNAWYRELGESHPFFFDSIPVVQEGGSLAGKDSRVGIAGRRPQSSVALLLCSLRLRNGTHIPLICCFVIGKAIARPVGGSLVQAGHLVKGDCKHAWLSQMDWMGGPIT